MEKKVLGYIILTLIIGLSIGYILNQQKYDKSISYYISGKFNNYISFEADAGSVLSVSDDICRKEFINKNPYYRLSDVDGEEYYCEMFSVDSLLNYENIEGCPIIRNSTTTAYCFCHY